jgi:hypothetical protein
MTSKIVIGKYLVKPSSVKWRRSVTSYINTCTIVLPKITYIKNNIASPTDDRTVPATGTTFVFNEGDAVSVKLGYNERNTLRFKGFIKTINITDKLELECEGFNYQLPAEFSASYGKTTLKQILTDLTAGTSIKISDKMPDVSVANVRFKNAHGKQVLDWIQKELHLTVFFDFDTIFAGTRYGLKNEEKPVKIKIRWNTVSDKNFKKRTATENIQIQLVDKNSAGEVKKIKSDEKKYSQTKEVKIKSGLDDEILRKIANDMQAKENYNGYEGALVLFLEPAVNPSDVVQVIDDKFPERAGLFFTETVEGSFGSSGGRQTVTLNYFYGN